MQNETTHITASQIRKMTKEAARASPHHAPNQPLMLRFPVKKTGMYVLQKVIDESKLEVQRRRVSDTLIVQCPQAMVEPTDAHRCKGDLSNLELKVTGTPPLRLKYRKVVNQIEHEAHFQSIQPEDFVSPLSHQTSDALTLRGNVDISWARAQTVTVPLSESLGTSGKWAFSLEEVTDAFGNAVSYTQREHDNQDRTRAKASHLHQVITVHERPVVQLNGCDPQHPLKVAKGMSAGIPVVKTSTGRGGFLDMPYEVEYLFTPEDKLLPNGDHSDSALRRQIVIKNAHSNPTVQHPGLYTLTRVKTEFCSGEVYEPASCLLQNPPEPSLRIDQEEIFDKCAKKAVGLRVDLHLTGTPPFNVQYKVTRVDHGRGDSKIAMKTIEGLRGQIELAPERAGHYTYEFTEISDAVYKGHALHGEGLVVEQDVKPSASAHIVHPSPKQVCIDEQVCYTVRFRGEGPFSLEYEVVRGNDRKRHEMRDIDKEETDICTDVLRKGGDYTLALASVTDRMGCKEFLKDDAKIHVRHQRPKASFGQVEGGRSIKTLEDKKVRLPVRLSGDAPWTITYRHKGHETQATMSRNNDGIEVQDEGTYEIMSVSDAVCPGAPDESTNKFEVKWVTRPQMRIAEGSYAEQVGKKYIKHEVCEGEEDSVDLHISGKSSIAYDILLLNTDSIRFPPVRSQIRGTHQARQGLECNACQNAQRSLGVVLGPPGYHPARCCRIQVYRAWRLQLRPRCPTILAPHPSTARQSTSYRTLHQPGQDIQLLLRGICRRRSHPHYSHRPTSVQRGLRNQASRHRATRNHQRLAHCIN